MATGLQELVRDKLNVLNDEELGMVLDFLNKLNGLNKLDSKRTSKRPTIADRFADIRAEIPELKWDDLPTDGAENIDHYLYGHPKKHR